ncbi:hypothetical protein FNL65_32245 [Pseudomonas aeruginosa]|uniref:hypothetical protein n=1 Tax=Pseudomonas aeruginosa TaxID=287 RepID=UPI00115D4C9A|nr:hypothetical protein [Pseudomonas aeruginosa]TRL94314.1 hypothetical protein FNL65_32245 [Pseudomonas aeruginosa]
MSNELTDVRCPCGDEYPADSYDAGFIAGSGMCQNCDAALPPKDICTCPSGDGSLVHPCPAHPAVEQVGGDERAAFELFVRKHCGMPAHIAVNWDAKFTNDAWAGWQARAALAQPSPAGEYGDAYQGAREDIAIWKRRALEAEQALRQAHNGQTFMGEPLVQPYEAPREKVNALFKVLGFSGTASVGDILDAALERLQAQPSPAQAEQAEAERPEVFGLERYRVERTGQGFWPYCVRAGDGTRELFVGHLKQCKRVAAQLATAFEDGKFVAGALRAENAKLIEALDESDGDRWRLRSERDAALARVAELEKQEPVATVAKVPGEDWNGLHFYRDLQGMQPGTKLYAAPVAQAQHSVPEGVTIERDVAGTIHIKVGDFDFIQLQYQRPYTDNASTWKLAERIASLLAAAPGKEGM